MKTSTKVLPMKRATIRLYGIVQGVGMRYFVYREARRLGLNGYVRNLSDGSVEIVVEGDEKLIENLVETIKTRGPGHVTNVKITYEPPRGDLKGFRIVF
ncbi:MAG: acylphosphatase [Desulfurococcaceae archaeon]